MYNHLSSIPSDDQFPIDPETWAKVVARLQLAPQQIRLIECLLYGLRDKQIAAKMGIKPTTVRAYFGRIFPRVGVMDRVELLIRVFVIAHEEGWGRNRHC